MLVRKKSDDATNKSMELIYNRYYAKLVVIAYGSTKDKQLAEDIVQECLYIASQNLHNMNGDVTCKKSYNYLVTMVKNKCIDVARRKKRYPEILFQDFNQYDAELFDSPLDYMVEHEKEKELINAIKSLDKKYSDVLYMKYVQDYSYEDIVRITGLSLNNTRVIISRGKKMLKSKLNKEQYKRYIE